MMTIWELENDTDTLICTQKNKSYNTHSIHISFFKQSSLTETEKIPSEMPLHNSPGK